jgi:hypothetical protein
MPQLRDGWPPHTPAGDGEQGNYLDGVFVNSIFLLNPLEVAAIRHELCIAALS